MTNIEPLTTEQIIEIDLLELVKNLATSKDYRHSFLVSFVMWQVSSQVKLLRTSRGLTQEQFADKCGISSYTVIRLEHPETCLNTSLNTLLKIAHRMDVGFVCRFVAYSEIVKELHSLQGSNHLEARLVPAPSTDVLEQMELEDWANEQITS